MRKIIHLNLLVWATTWLLLSLPLASWSQTASEKPKRIYITLDVSGSMDGNKYIMANYAAQTIAVFSNPEDLVNVYYLGKRHGIGSSNGYKQLQIPFDRHPGQNTYHEISDLSAFLKDYRPDPNYQDWLFIIGDGDWNYSSALTDYETTTRKLSDLFASGQLQVCYLQTGNTLSLDYPFTDFLISQSSPQIEIRRSDTTATSVLNNCTFFTNKILGFSNTRVPLQQQGSSCVTFRSEFPLDHCVLVYQSDKPNANEMAISSVDCGQRQIRYRVKGNPSTKPLVQPGSRVLNGVVWELSCPQTMPANETVKVCFNQNIDVRNLTLYPYVDVTLRMQPFSMVQDELPQTGTEFFRICDKDDKVLVKISATDKLNHKFPPPLMQRMNVKIVAGGKELTAVYSDEDTTFRAVLEMPDDTLTYFSKVESPGYFSRVSPQQTVVKSNEVCPPDRIPLITLPVQRFDAVTFEALMEGGGFEGFVRDTLFQALVAAGSFDDRTISASHSWMLESAGLSINGYCITITQKSKSGLCECAFPDTLRYEVTLRATNGILHDGKLYEGFVIPITVPVEKRSWWARCWVYVALFFGLLLFIIYLRALRKKHRFGKYACITAVHYNRFGEEDDLTFQTYLRKKSKSAWLSRWFSPADEKYMPSFVSPDVSGIMFVAGETPSYVNVPKANIIPPKIKIPNFNPESDTNPSKYIRLADNDKIEVMKNEFTKEGYLQYNAGQGGTGGGRKRLSALLMLTLVVAECFVAWMIIKSLIITLF